MGQKSSAVGEASYFIEVKIDSNQVLRSDLASYFGSKKRSGGGEISCIVYPWDNEPNKALVEFDKNDCPKDIVANVLAKTHKGYTISLYKMISPFRGVETSLTPDVYNLLRKSTSFNDTDFIEWLENESHSGVKLTLDGKLVQVKGCMHRVQALQQFVEYHLRNLWKRPQDSSPVKTAPTGPIPAPTGPIPAPRDAANPAPALPVAPLKPTAPPNIAPKPITVPVALDEPLAGLTTRSTSTVPPHLPHLAVLPHITARPPTLPANDDVANVRDDRQQNVSVPNKPMPAHRGMETSTTPFGSTKKNIPVEDDAESTGTDSSSFPSLSSQPPDDDMESVSGASETSQTTDGLERVNGKFAIDIHEHTKRRKEYKKLVNAQLPKGFLREEDCEGEPSRIRLTFWNDTQDGAGEFMDAYYGLHLEVARTLSYEDIKSDGGDSLEYIVEQMTCDNFTARVECVQDEHIIKVAAPHHLIQGAKSQVIRTLNDYGVTEKYSTSPTQSLDSSSHRSDSPSQAAARTRKTDTRPKKQFGIAIPNPKTFTINNIDVTVKHGELVSCPVDVICFPAEPNLSYKAGLAKRVAKCGGSEQVEEINRCLNNQNQRPMKVGSIWPQKARGELAERGIKFVIHAILPGINKEVKKSVHKDDKEWEAEKEKREKSLTQFSSTLRKVLNQAQTTKCRSVAFSALSGGRPQHLVSRSFISTVKEFSRKNTDSCIKEIVYVDINSFMVRNLMEHFEKQNKSRDENLDLQGSESAKNKNRRRANKKQKGSGSNLQKLSCSLASSQLSLASESDRSNTSSPAHFSAQHHQSHPHPGLSQPPVAQMWQPQNDSRPVPNHMRLLGKPTIPAPLVPSLNNAVMNSNFLATGGPPQQTMNTTVLSISLPGYNQASTIQITYKIPDGIQQVGCPAPGTPYKGTTRHCYLPQTVEGGKLVPMLQEAFHRRLLFKVVLGKKGGYQIDFSDVMQKTKVTDGGRFGYPDDNHLRRLEQTLIAKGIRPPF